jgi:hypothetical protein
VKLIVIWVLLFLVSVPTARLVAPKLKDQFSALSENPVCVNVSPLVIVTTTDGSTAPFAMVDVVDIVEAIANAMPTGMHAKMSITASRTARIFPLAFFLKFFFTILIKHTKYSNTPRPRIVGFLIASPKTIA